MFNNFRLKAYVKFLRRHHSYIKILLKTILQIFSHTTLKIKILSLHCLQLYSDPCFVLGGFGLLWSNVCSQALLEWWTTGYCFMVNSVTRSIKAWLMTIQRQPSAISVNGNFLFGIFSYSRYLVAPYWLFELIFLEDYKIIVLAISTEKRWIVKQSPSVRLFDRLFVRACRIFGPIYSIWSSFAPCRR